MNLLRYITQIFRLILLKRNIARRQLSKNGIIASKIQKKCKNEIFNLFIQIISEAKFKKKTENKQKKN